MLSAFAFARNTLTHFVIPGPLLRQNPKLLAEFLDRLFNTLNWTITEFSVAMKDMLDAMGRRMVPDMRQGLTLVHFSAQRKRFLWHRGCV